MTSPDLLSQEGVRQDGLTQPDRGELRRGWRNLWAATIGIGLGIASYTPVSSLFFHALELEFGWSKAATAGAFIALPVTAVALPLAGWLIDRYGVRTVSGLSALFAAVSYVCLARLGAHLSQFYLGILGLSVLGCATGPVAYTRLVAAQFHAQRGLALAIAQFGVAFVAAVMPQCIGWMIAVHGWRSAYYFFAAATVFGAVCAQALMQPIADGRPDETALEGQAPKAAITSAPFWILGAAIFAITTGSFGLLAQFRSVLADRGNDLQTTTAMLSVLAIAAMVSRLVVGRMLDLPKPGRSAAAIIAVAAIGGATFLLAPSGLIATTLAVILIGCSVGAELDILSYFCARFFGIRHYGALYGMLSAFFYVGVAVGAVSYSVVRTKTGSYRLAVLETTVLLFVAAILLWTLEWPKPAARTPGPH